MSSSLSRILERNEMRLERIAGSPEAMDVKTPAAATSIEDLPENVLLYILSFLPALDAIQTTVISPKWRNLWANLPSLSFDYNLFLPPYDTPSLTRQGFVDFISRALILRSDSADLRDLRLQFDHSDETPRYKSQIDSYIRYAVAHNVQHLAVAFYSKYIRLFDESETDIIYDFRLSFLRNSSLTGLTLERCNLTLPIGDSRFRFDTLRSLTLEEVYLTDSMISQLVSDCVNLEYLGIRRCLGMKDVKIESWSLKALGLYHFKCDDGSVEILAPKLRKLSVLFFEVGSYVMENSPELSQAYVYFERIAENYAYWSKVLMVIGNVERLTMQNWGLKFMAEKDIICPRPLYNLKHLKVQTDYSKSDLIGMSALFQLAPNLDTLVLDPDFKFYNEVVGDQVEIKFHLPRLKVLKITCYRGAEDDCYFLKLVMKNGIVLEKIVLDHVQLGSTPITPTILVKQPQGYQVVQGFFVVSQLSDNLNFYLNL